MSKFVNKKNIFRAVAIIVAISLIGFGIWFFQSYPPLLDNLNAVTSDSSFVLEDKGNYWLLSYAGSQADTLLIFYPGAKVQPLSYVYNLSGLVSPSLAVAITKPPFNYAFFDINEADKVLSGESSYSRFYLSGHSLGGVVACWYAGSNGSKIQGLILLASYCSNDVSSQNIRSLSIIGSRDGLTEIETVKSSQSQLGSQTRLVVIDGMNHAQFGSYGNQQGDLSSQISDQDAKTQVNDLMLEFINQN